MVLIISCNKHSEKICITGKIERANKLDVFLEELLPNKIDTIKICKTDKNGNFEIKLLEYKNCFYRLKLDNDNFIYLYLKDNDQIYINSKYPRVANGYNISGSLDCELLRKINEKLITCSDSINKLKQLLINYQYLPDYEFDSLHNILSRSAKEIFDSEKQFLIDFIKNNYKSPTIYIALNQYIDSSPILSIENDLDIYDFVLINLKKFNPDLEQITILESIVSKQKLKIEPLNNSFIKIKPNSEAPDFSITNSENKKIKLSEFNNKNVLIYFWASWSKPSIENIKQIIEIKSKYKNNLEIILFSLDSDSEKWKKTINSLNIANFINVCDFKIWESSIIKVYEIKNIPMFVLINSNQKFEVITQNIELLNNTLEKMY